MRHHLPILLAALWWGSLSAIGFLAVPMLFAHLPTPVMAGNMAARLFEAQTFVSAACGMGLLLASQRRGDAPQEAWAKEAMPWIIGGLLLALLVQYGVAPRIVARTQLKLWHSVGTVMYALQWLCALRVLWRASAPR
ncbi:DUF4149 domain-containing protein [Paracidovorax avenae]|uniref:TMEM205-like domain-containing protein n=1 Tax=Paracidovorax avenae (strain ATCC 19860 / DSM 7227 / CCUG 15838 / JCM 20985 / LMG 2117 / NCPPB 1011) TaxID=643561 RepID=F0Q1H7_PARA1|nr:DUF4149 domain-containing protein [Paracidovorax avenae]ADX46502.1 hypothetical protein Acav_2590 [Paracidovorax avenae ATCC 19860]AVS67260.1 DUF4149 domain-containing protein [Paracidovorax avenae]AVS70863.1 DUF4149 domain-containing protein [Paracidovorax avenae]AVS78071.1 DUF4149 domain-containing protein [Paracidovorax avenae]AVS90768.1 DUF4149 domain-containing protein [Paracidovorax avenae]